MSLGLDQLVETLKAAGETTRMRLIALLSAGDLTVTDLTDILGQSQPRISRHLKLLLEAGLIERYQEGAWAYFRLKREGEEAGVANGLLAALSFGDAVIARDAERLAAVKRERAAQASEYFSRNAAEWDEIRRLHVSEEKVEAALVGLVGEKTIDSLLDLGTGTAASCSFWTANIARPSASMRAATCSPLPEPISTRRARRGRACAMATSSTCRWKARTST